MPRLCNMTENGAMTLVNTRGRGQANTEDPELGDLVERNKTKELPALLMNWNLKVGVLQHDGHHPVAPLNSSEDQLIGLHLELGFMVKFVQDKEVYNWSPQIRCPHNNKHAAVISCGGRSQLYCPLLYQRQDFPVMEVGENLWKGIGSMERGGMFEKGIE